MKRISLILLGLLMSFCITGINQSWAELLDLSDPLTPSGTINGAIFETWDANPAGRGAYGTFLAIQGHGTSQGYNSDNRPVEFDETNAKPHNHSLLLNDVGQVYIGGVW